MKTLADYKQWLLSKFLLTNFDTVKFLCDVLIDRCEHIESRRLIENDHEGIGEAWLSSVDDLMRFRGSDGWWLPLSVNEDGGINVFGFQGLTTEN